MTATGGVTSALSSMLQQGRPLRREYSMVISSVDNSLFEGKQSVKIVAGHKEQLAKRVAERLGVNEMLRLYFFDPLVPHLRRRSYSWDPSLLQHIIAALKLDRSRTHAVPTHPPLEFFLCDIGYCDAAPRPFSRP